ncbi:5-oxoprolinase subunit PxpB [Rhodospirillum rubrum]|uniref:Carboxyltransferase domain-containing protein n=1 Tax=Rhodospirillum rubrum (strain ATCC 11170 / ATH 1.1.1 / DSM 467 / LMG 4362 / NCIMB 8255 / S1) TaxID=269796 RepID=Q2RU88_RHORT|nr:5-oxoprolinase subunit PxpB [Rhodospirillum rubrum]ABC22307.1 conserved hypothetical protein [Rhodospirillum rubrum ATCC 11170]AEO48026.1 hypothetical protein F11_07780 [Rhodospirillum rubrum F11]MBK5953875.1 allophanate hydrolase subunit 1 [Rhodospirillum rubrum]QXG81949.1 5-oxoprolinase subunit PxpB [Rhodospirillum rubrum]HAQ00947.1 allophanate hydrolase subunit 1 [Rhodospirillum rubrum]
MTDTLTLVSAGDCAFGVVFGETITPAVNARVQALHRRLRAQAAEFPGLIESVPGFTTLLIHYDPLLTGRAELEPRLRALLAEASVEPAQGRAWRLPVCYQGSPDLDAVARATGLSAAEVTARHEQGRYVVYVLGFLPGFAYLGDLDPALALPRRAEPRLTVPAGSLAIAERLTAVYPWESPGGWHLIGHCPVPLFNASQASPALLAPGDQLRFFAVNRAEHEAWVRRVAEPGFDPADLIDGAP